MFKRILLPLVFLMAGLLSAAATEPKLPGGDGSSFEAAVIIRSAGDSARAGTESAWLSTKYTGWKIIIYSRIQNGGRFYDVFVISKDAQTKKVYFDVTS